MLQVGLPPRVFVCSFLIFTRENETFENAEARGRAMVRSIYGPNTGYDGSKTKNAAPDYSWIVTSTYILVSSAFS